MSMSLGGKAPHTIPVGLSCLQAGISNHMESTAVAL